MSDKDKTTKKDSKANLTDDKKKEDKGKKKVEEPEDDEELSESSEEEEGAAASKLGFVELAKGKKEKFNTVYLILHNGSLYWYKDSRDLKPAGPGIGLKAHKLVKNPEGIKKDNCLGLESDKTSYYLGFATALDMEGWKAAIEKNSSLEEGQPPERSVDDVGEKKKQGVFGRAKKKMAGDIASSKLGKSVIKKILNEETTSLLTAMKKIVTKESSKKRADELEKSIIKLTVKAYLLMENKKIDPDAFIAADKPLRTAFELIVKIHNGRGRAKPDQVTQAVAKCETHFKSAETIITGLLQPHLSPKNMFGLAQTFGYLGSAKFLEKVLTDDSLEEAIEPLIDAIDYWTQFSNY